MARGFVIGKQTLTKDTLLKIAQVGVITLAATTSPYFLHRLAKEYFHEKAKRRQRTRAAKLRELERRKLIKFEELGGGSIRLTLTHRGKELVRQYDIDTIKLKIPARWDGRWHIISYDIPTPQKKASNAFREKLRSMGLFPLQKSLWVSPYDCLPEIEFLATVFEINLEKHIYYFLASEIPNKKEVEKFFRL